jgi:hypothetical protein
MPHGSDNRRAGLLTGLVVFCLIAGARPAAAQNRAMGDGESAGQPAAQVAMRFDVPLSAGAFAAGRLPNLAPSLAPNMPLDPARSATEERSAGRNPVDRISVNSTPFASETSLPLCAIFGGGVQVSGLYTVNSMENLLWGLPGAGSLPAWSATGGQSHISVLAPQQAETYGIALRLHPAVLESKLGASLPGHLMTRILRASRG